MQKLRLLAWLMVTLWASAAGAQETPAASAAPVPGPQAPAAAAPAWEFHPGAVLWLSKPFAGKLIPRTSASLYFLKLGIDWKHGNFGFYAEPRFRDQKLRSYMASNVYVQEAYGWWKSDFGPVLKFGKVGMRFGRQTDGGFMQTLPYYDGMKLRADYGFSAEGAVPAGDLKVGYAAQYFLIDGEDSPAIPVGRDTNYYNFTLPDGTVAGSRQRNIANVRVDVATKFGSTSRLSAGVGVQYLNADLTPLAYTALIPLGRQDVMRYEVDATLDIGPFQLYGEYIYQNGRHVLDFPVPGGASARNSYLIAFAGFRIANLTIFYNHSIASYLDASHTEVIYRPGLRYNLTPNLWIVAEYNYWTRSDLAAGPFDSSANLTFWAWY